MLNGSPLNSGPMNASGGDVAPPAPPVEIHPPESLPTPLPPLPPVPGAPPVYGYTPAVAPAGYTYRWTLALIVGGVDVTSLLSGSVEIDREEGAAGVASFSLFYPVGEAVPVELITQAITIDYITETGGVMSQARRYTGFVTEPAWDPVSRLMRIDCSDRVQFRVEAMPLEQIDALVGGYWSVDLFEPAEGRSRWDYALERLGTRPVSLDCSREGELRVSSWYATEAPAFVFAAGSTVYQSVEVELAQLSAATNRVELEFSYRYSRLWQRNQRYSWLVPAGNFCNWRINTHDLPTIDMIESAATDGGQTMINPDYVLLPPSAPDPCFTGAPWINNFTDLLVSAAWTGARRWTQTVTETYRFALATPAGEIEGAQTVARDSASLQIEADRIEAWTDDPIKGGVSGYDDVHDEARRQAAGLCALHQARVTIIDAHRRTTVSWAVPTSQVLACDLTHTLRLEDGMRAQGKCRRVVDSFDLLSGLALTTLSIAVMRGGGVSDPLVVPARLGLAPADPGGAPIDAPTDALPSQIGGLSTSPEYDPTRDGFSGNYTAIDNDVGQEPYPRDMRATAREIPAEVRDEAALTADVLIRVGIPNDLLEL